MKPYIKSNFAYLRQTLKACASQAEVEMLDQIESELDHAEQAFDELVKIEFKD